MSDRINDWLDGELPFEALTDREQADARALEVAIRAAAGRIADVPAPELTAAVMSRLPARPGSAERASSAPAGARARLRAWLAAAAPAGGLGLRPAVALAALSLAVGFAFGKLVPPFGQADAGTAATATAVDAAEPAPRLFVRFELEAEGATGVRLAGSFTGWEAAIELTQLGDGRWMATVPLEPGVHDYVFIVDEDQLVVDPSAPRVADGFGGYSSRLALLTPAS
jgi:hypothetical protein